MSPKTRSSRVGEREEASRLLTDDADLARALLEGRRDAAPYAWRRYNPLVISTLRRMLGPSDDIPDLAQDVFARFFTKIPELKKQGSLRAFVTGIAFRRAREEIKRRRVRRTSAALVLHHEHELSLARITDPERRHAAARLYRLMSRLSPKDLDAYMLRFIEGLEFAEIAEVLHVSLSTVRRNIRRAMEQIDRLVRGDPLFAYAELGSPGPGTRRETPKRPPRKRPVSGSA